MRLECAVNPWFCNSISARRSRVFINPFDRDGYPLRRFDFGGEPRDKALYRNARAEAHFTPTART